MDFIEEIKKRIPKCDSPPAVAISGGIDSTAILHHVCEKHELVMTFTAIFQNEHDERVKAHRVADHYKTVHEDVVIEKQEFLLKLEGILIRYPFPRYNLWPWILVERIAMSGCRDLFIGEGSDELFGYPDRSFLHGWAGQLVWVWPAWEEACKYYGVVLYAPWLELETSLEWRRRKLPITELFSPFDKQTLRNAYNGILPDFVRDQNTVPPSLGFYKMIGMGKDELQIEAVKAWLSSRVKE